MDELRGNVRYEKEYRNSGIICITETWLNKDTPTNLIDIPGFVAVRQDRSYEDTCKTKGGGLCVYINKLWCNNFTLRSSFCSANIKLLCISFRPFYLPREFPQVHVCLVYVPPDADAELAANVIHDQVHQLENQSPLSPTIVLGDLNHCLLDRCLPHYHQFINRPTRGENILDRCYCSIQEAYKAVIRPSLGNSDHQVIHLLPKYKQQLKREKQIKRTVQLWNTESVDRLQTAFEITDWDVLLSSGGDIYVQTDVVNCYVRFCESQHIATKTITEYPNNKSWLTKEVKLILQERKQAHRAGDHAKVKDLNRIFRREVRLAKVKYRQKLEHCFQNNNPKGAWRCLEMITDYKTPKNKGFQNIDDSKQKADDLNEFYCRFDNIDMSTTLDLISDDLRQMDDTPISIEERDVVKQFKLINPNKATGPDETRGRTLKCCATRNSI